jgi:hypothetical protein
VAKQPWILKATKGPGYAVVFNGSTYVSNTAISTILNGTPYSICCCERRNDSTANGGAKYNIYFGGNDSVVNDQKLHVGYKNTNSMYLAQYGDDADLSVTSFTTAAAETINYNFFMHNQDHKAYLYSYRGSTTPISKASVVYNSFLSAQSDGYLIGSGHNGGYIGEIYELILFNKSLQNLDTTGGLRTQIYDNQSNYTGVT